MDYVRSWIVTSAKNLLIDNYRKKSPSLLKDEEVISNLLVEHHDPEKKYLIKYTIEETLRHFSETDKTIFLAKEYYGYKYKEISALMDMPVSSVKSRIFRVKKIILSSIQRGDDFEK